MPTWTPQYAVGHPVIDAQHQELFARADALLEAMHDGRAAPEVGQLLQFLRTYVVEHFGAEERLMEEGRYPATAEHEAEHAVFARRLQAAADVFRREGATAALAQELRDLLRGWLITHVCTVDLHLAASLRDGEASGGRASAARPAGRGR